MKKFLQLVLVPALLLGLFTQAFAEVKPESFSVSPYVAGYSFLGRERLETGPAAGLRGGYNFTSHFGLEAVLTYISTEGKAYSGIGDVDALNYHLDMLYHFMPESTLVPYLAMGYGGHWRDYEGDGEVNRSAFNYGGGVKYFLTDAMALRGDVRHIVMRDHDDTFHNLEYGVGVDFIFGGAKAAPAVAAAPVAAPVVQPPAEEVPLEPVPAA